MFVSTIFQFITFIHLVSKGNFSKAKNMEINQRFLLAVSLEGEDVELEEAIATTEEITESN